MSHATRINKSSHISMSHIILFDCLHIHLSINVLSTLIHIFVITHTCLFDITSICFWSVRTPIWLPAYTSPFCVSSQHSYTLFSSYINITLILHRSIFEDCALTHDSLHICLFDMFLFNTHTCLYTAYPIWSDIFASSFESSKRKLERLFCRVSVKTKLRALSFKLWKDLLKILRQIG